MRINDLTGQKFGKLTVIRRVQNSGSSKWLCHCECGNDKIVFGTNLINGKTRSCGCTKVVHGDSKTKLYNVHNQILYNGVCDEWKDYTAFKKWAMDNGYKEGVRIQRKDITKPYSPDNCFIK